MNHSFANACHRVKSLACIRGDLPLFSELSFQLKSGQGLWIKGPNGIGKSSLMRQLAGLLPVDLGLISWDFAADTKAEEARDLLHYIGHANGLDPELTPRQSLTFWARIYDQASIDPAIQAMKLDSFADLPCRYLSSGQKRRTALARLALAARPIWLLDEPLVGLDQQAEGLVAQLIASQLDRQGSVVMISHQQSAPLAQRFGILDLASWSAVS